MFYKRSCLWGRKDLVFTSCEHLFIGTKIPGFSLSNTQQSQWAS